MVDDHLRPRLGRIRQQGRRMGAFRAQVGRALARASPRPGRASGASSRGRRLGRLFAKAFGRRPGQRRVIVKVRLVRLGGDGRSAARQYLRYLQRDGVSLEGERGALYGPPGVEIEPEDFISRGAEDRHQFRIILAPEDGVEMGDLRPFVRGVMAQMEKDLETRLDWAAVDHFDRAHPHSHVIVRGVDELGGDLVIARGYLSHGLRYRASEVATRELGLQGEREVERKLVCQLDQERVTDIDRAIGRQVSNGGIWDQAHGGQTPIERALALGRLGRLVQMGLADELAPGRWRLGEGWMETLKALGERGDIQKAVHRGLARAGIDQGLVRFASHDLTREPEPSVEGIIIDRGLHDEHAERHYVLIDGTDGRAHYLIMAPKSPVDGLEVGQVFEPISDGRRASAPELQVEVQGPTWLDRKLAGEGRPLANPRLQTQLAGYFARRLERLKSWGLAHEPGEGSGINVVDDLIPALRRLEIDAQVRALEHELGRPCTSTSAGERVTGQVHRLIDLHSGHFAVIDRGHTLSLVPSNAAIERRLGRRVDGTLTHDGFVLTKRRRIALPDMG